MFGLTVYLLFAVLDTKCALTSFALALFIKGVLLLSTCNDAVGLNMQ